MKKDEYRITWKDPESNPKWMSADELDEWISDVKDTPCKSVGVIVRDNKNEDFIVLCSDKQGKNIGNCTLIYKSLIIKRQRI